MESWFDLTPHAVGIDWMRYIWRQAGLVVASISFRDLISYELAAHGFSFSLDSPGLFWFGLGTAGGAAFLFYDRLAYTSFIARNLFRRTSWQPDWAKASLSFIANLVVLICLVGAFVSLRPHIVLAYMIHSQPKTIFVVVSLAVFGIGVALLRHALHGWFGFLLRRLAGLPLQPALFSNLERDRLLRLRIPAERLGTSPIDLAFTVTDMETGRGHFFFQQASRRSRSEPANRFPFSFRGYLRL